MTLNPNPNLNPLLEISLTAWSRGGPPSVRTQLLFSLERKGEQNMSALSIREPRTCQRGEAGAEHSESRGQGNRRPRNSRGLRA